MLLLINEDNFQFQSNNNILFCRSFHQVVFKYFSILKSIHLQIFKIIKYGAQRQILFHAILLYISMPNQILSKVQFIFNQMPFQLIISCCQFHNSVAISILIQFLLEFKIISFQVVAVGHQFNIHFISLSIFHIQFQSL